MLRRTLTLSAAALVAAFIGFSAARAMPITAANNPLPLLQTSPSSNVELARYGGGGRRYIPRGGYRGGYRGGAYRRGYARGYGRGYGRAYYRGGRYYGGRYYRGRYWRPGVGVAVGAALAAPYYYGGGYYGSNARWCVNRYGRRYVCGYY